jgi:uncharacterized protein
MKAQRITRPFAFWHFTHPTHAMLTIDITSLDPGVHHVELRPDPDDADLDPDDFSDLFVSARLDCQDDRILAMLDTEATAHLICDRTLQPFDELVHGHYGVLFAPPAFRGSPDEDDRYDEVRELHHHDREIEVTDLVRDTLLLAVPQRQVAPGAEEEELQTAYGAPDEEEADEEKDAIDPRWEKLRALKDEED